jgi:membrane-associated phospholipid phosphatase
MLRPVRRSGARPRSRRLLPRGPADALRQLALFAVAYVGYRLVRGLVEDDVGAAFWHATQLISLEHSLGFFIEPTVQGWVAGRHWLMSFASWMYVNAHFVVTFSALAWLYLFRNRSFYFVRNMFMVAMGLALLGYFLYPTAPPRLMPEWGFTDSVAKFTGIKDADSPVGTLVNLYAAVPSMHVAFALMIGLPLAKLVNSRVLKVLWRLYPLLVTWVVVVTGNHFVMDAIIGAVVAGVSAVAAQWLLARARPGVWAFRPAHAEAAA